LLGGSFTTRSTFGVGRVLVPSGFSLLLVSGSVGLGGTILVLLLESLLVALVEAELLFLALFGGLLGSLGAIGEPSSRGLLLAHLTVLRLTSITKGSISARHVKSWSLLLSLSRSLRVFGSISGIDVKLVVFDILHFHVVAISLGSVVQHDGRRSTSRFDPVSADVTLIHRVDRDILSDVDIVGEVDLRSLTALVLGLRAES
jgi:hypothetical protein